MSDTQQIPEACPFCGCGMTVMDDGAPMHQGRKWYETERVVCLERQLAHRNRDLTAARERITRLEEAGDAMAAYEFLPDRLAENWTAAKEAKP